MNRWRVRAAMALAMTLVAVALAASCGGGGDDDDDNDDDDDGGAIWRPGPGTSWQWQLTGTIDESFEVVMYDIDLFDVETETIAALRDAGRAVICYFSAGSYENWREDAGEFPEEALGAPLEGWAGERWLDVRSDAVRAIMAARLDVAAAKGCDGVEPDNVDGYANANGLGLTAADQIDYNRFIAGQAHARGLSVGLKNDTDQIEELVDDFDWALNEECHAYDECDVYDAFLDEEKAVFNAEYVDDWSDAASLADEACGTPGFSTIVKEWDLTARRLGCE